jgi:hypothetical protein
VCNLVLLGAVQHSHALFARGSPLNIDLSVPNLEFLCLNTFAISVSVRKMAAPTTLISTTLSGPSTGNQTLAITADVSKPSPPEVTDGASGIYSFEYTGRHDGGDLPPVSDNYYNHLVAALREAKVKTDALIVEAQAKEKGGAPASKRAKSEE